MNKLIILTSAIPLLLLTGHAQADVVHADDTIIQGSVCTGFDCINNENFGADTIRLKENNLRIHFDDTSSTGSFPSNDWRLVANDQASGGANYFAIEDSTAGGVPFKVTAGAPSNSLFISSSGNLGLGTSTPVLDAHIVNGDTPAIRLEQDSSSGYSAQTWDVAGNETNFFIRDVTNGSKLPFKIIPGAPTNSLYVASSGNVGLGTPSPDANLHVIGKALVSPSDSGAPANQANLHVIDTSSGAVLDSAVQGIKLENTSTTENPRVLFVIENKGPTGFAIKDNSDNGDVWYVANDDGALTFFKDSLANPLMKLKDNGDLQVKGSVTPNAF